MASGEVSRYVYQMKYHYRLPIEEKMIGYPIMAKKIRDIVVPKDKYVMSQLLRYHKGGDRYLSASAINTYITCPLQFYLSYVEKFQEIDDVSEGVDARGLRQHLPQRHATKSMSRLRLTHRS